MEEQNNVIFECSAVSSGHTPSDYATIFRHRKLILSNVISLEIGLACVLFILYYMLDNGLLLFLSGVCFVLFVLTIRKLNKEKNERQELCIRATDEEMHLVYLDLPTGEITSEYIIPYGDINRGYFTDKACKQFVLILYNGQSLMLTLRPQSLQQYFFLYIVPDYINLTSPPAWKILKRFGTKKSYEKILRQRGDIE